MASVSYIIANGYATGQTDDEWHRACLWADLSPQMSQALYRLRAAYWARKSDRRGLEEALAFADTVNRHVDYELFTKGYWSLLQVGARQPDVTLPYVGRRRKAN